MVKCYYDYGRADGQGPNVICLNCLGTIRVNCGCLLPPRLMCKCGAKAEPFQDGPWPLKEGLDLTNDP